MKNPRMIGDSVLVFITFCWGITFPLVENAMQVIDPFVFVTVRFLFAALILLPFIYRDFKKSTDNRLLIKAGCILGAINVVVYSTQSIGLETISAGQSAFITGVCVVIIPFLMPLFRMGYPSRADVISSIFCLIGLALLTGVDLSQMNAGSLWTLVCAFAVAFSIVYLQHISQKISALSALAFYQIFFTGILCGPLSIGKSYTPVFDTTALMALGFCAIFGTSIALLLQTKYQRLTTASRAAVIFSLEPLFASVFGYLINGETLGLLALCGGFIIIFSLLIPEIVRMIKNREQDTI